MATNSQIAFAPLGETVAVTAAGRYMYNVCKSKRILQQGEV